MLKAQGLMSLFFKNTQSRLELVGSVFIKEKVGLDASSWIFSQVWNHSGSTL